MTPPTPGQRLLTRGLLRYDVIDVDLVSVTFSVEGFDRVNVVLRRQWDRLTKGAKLLPGPESAPSASVNERGAER